MQSLPTTPLWSAIAVLAWRLGCAAVARRCAGTVYRRFVEIIRCGESCKTQPMTNLRLRRSVVSNCSPAVLRAASRTILVYADVSLASTQAERPVGDPPIELSVPDTHKQMNRLRVAKKILLAMELATYFDDASLMQEAALRLGNCLAPLLDAAFRPRALFTPIAQCIALLGVSAAHAGRPLLVWSLHLLLSSSSSPTQSVSGMLSPLSLRSTLTCFAHHLEHRVRNSCALNSS